MVLKHLMTNRQNLSTKLTKLENPEDTWVRTKAPETVQGMFTEISPTYDALNHILSLNIDRRWRKVVARQVISPGVALVLDVCGGTGDLSLALDREARARHLKPLIVCSDFTPAMTAIARQKFESIETRDNLVPLVADTTALPFPDDYFDAVTVAFGIRNVVDPHLGLQEMARVCKPGGKIVVLEFSKTRNAAINWGFGFYFEQVLPLIGRLVTGTRAYSYLSKSVQSFPEGAAFCNMMSEATGAPATAQRLSFGIATVYSSHKG